MEVHVLEVLGQSFGAYIRHPISVSVEEVYLDLGPHLADYLFDAADRLQRPPEQRVKPSLAALIDLAYVLHVSLPSGLLLIGQL